MKNKDFTCFNEWKKQLIEYKSKIHWIDKNGKNHYLWSKTPTLDQMVTWIIKNYLTLTK